MRELFKKPTTITRIEFWAATTIFAFTIFLLITEGFRADDEKAQLDFYQKNFIPQLINYIFQFFFVLCLNFVLIPKLLKREALFLNIFFVVLLLAATGILFGVTGTHLKSDLYAGKQERDAIDEAIFEEGFEKAFMIIGVVAIYTAIKLTGFYLLSKSKAIQARYKFIRREAIAALILWMIGLLLLLLMPADAEFIMGWIIVIPSAIFLYLASFHSLIPRSVAYKSYQFLFYALKGLAIATVSFFVILFLLSAFISSAETAAGISLFNSLFQIFITVPVTWALYKRYLKGNEEINVLQKELKRSSASVDFLRSQINPHFLFNALNTLYGTAIQENADRTSEGIQKLGDMMRFMLQENMQDKISLSREIDYLNNYISLQRLRTDSNPIVQIQTEIQNGENFFQIAPMLLIPFVENAFKHGISFREPSHIKVTLEIKDDRLYFDVYNSKHRRQDNDPERDKSGIGLENVKQRLKLLYQNKHELIIRDTTKEFFVHLTIELTKLA